MTRSAWLQVSIAILCAFAVLVFLRVRDASGAPLPSDSTSAGHRLAQAWCKDCHAIEATGARGGSARMIELVEAGDARRLIFKI